MFTKMMRLAIYQEAKLLSFCVNMYLRAPNEHSKQCNGENKSDDIFEPPCRYFPAQTGKYSHSPPEDK